MNNLTFLTVEEASILLNTSKRRVQQLCKEGRIKNATIKDKVWLIPKESIDLYLDKNEIKQKLPLPIGVVSYIEASTSYYYVDKTLLIKEWIDTLSKVTLFTRPRRFGKTMAMDMLKTFFEKSDEDTSIYFKDKNIWHCGEKYRSYQGKYPVIFLTFKDTKLGCWEKTKEAICSLISEEFIRHSLLLDNPKINSFNKETYRHLIEKKATEYELISSLSLLSKLLKEEYHENVMIIIDEYDTPILDGYMNGYYNEVILFMRNFFSNAFKDNPSLKSGFLTGILRVGKESIFSGLNNLKIDSILEGRYASFFGFTKEEVVQMLKYYHLEYKLNEVIDWYDGYQFGGVDIFNPWSIINYMEEGGVAKPYWVDTSSNDVIQSLLKNVSEKEMDNLKDLLTGDPVITSVDTSVIYPKLNENPSTIYSFLLVCGYLKVVGCFFQDFDTPLYQLMIPNKEIELVYTKEILSKFNQVIGEVRTIAIKKALIENDSESLKNELNQFLLETVSFYDTIHESFYHGLLLGIVSLFNKSYQIKSNREEGIGRFDIAMIPYKIENPAIIIEVKSAKKKSEESLKELAKKALNQINEKDYSYCLKKFNDGNIKMIKFGIAFCGKKTEIVSE